jgi:hypothetical protein
MGSNMSEFQFAVDEIVQYERPVTFRMPFRYGVVTLSEAPESYVRVRITTRDGKSFFGYAADLMAPKWFDKSPELSDADNHDQLRLSVAIAAQHCLDHGGHASAFAYHAAIEADHHRACARRGLPGLVAGFGLAQIDRAILDACCRAWDVPFARAINGNLPGIDTATAPDLAGFDMPGFLRSLHPRENMVLRHTIGLTDAIEKSDLPSDAPDDRLPSSLEENCVFYGLGAFKIKLSGDIPADIDRLARIASVLERRSSDYFCTLDGNEQFDGPEEFDAFWKIASSDGRLSRIMSSVQIVEQPIARKSALSVPLGKLGRSMACEIDESDSDIDAFPAARELGYRGISSKSCKGVYRSLLNRARVEFWNSVEKDAGYFMSAEDLSTQAGLALQQDLALAGMIGCTHIERNGHQYGDGLSGAPSAWREALLNSHGDLYRNGGNRLLLHIDTGAFSFGSVYLAGYGTGLQPATLTDHLPITQCFSKVAE